MAVAFGVSLGAIAMATVIFRGALGGESAVGVMASSLMTWAVFTALGYAGGAAMDILVRQDLEAQFRRRLSRFREEVESVGGDSGDQGRTPKQDA
ncbi:hypothetical protein [Candidatus Laterigemmans baculatus]|uniref:hypothetical protein n=1 Tax=Candidatus Laterigemmans baculatus TaxID=2770505 RepID=UPI0013DC302A|nr:hypothetical protein [Candidatus Laterigemmans baculatus]